MNLNDIGPGDRVESCLKGWGTVKSVGSDFFTTRFDVTKDTFNYLKNGKFFNTDLNSEIIQWKPINEKKNKEYWMVRIPEGATKMKVKTIWYSQFPNEKTTENAYNQAMITIKVWSIIAEEYPNITDYPNFHYVIYYREDLNKWIWANHLNHNYIGLIRMPGGVAREIVNQLNSGMLKL